MENPRYPRTPVKHSGDPRDPMELPPLLFSKQSPWNRIIQGSAAFPEGVITTSDNQRVMLVAFDIMREFSWEALAKDHQKLEELLLSGPLSGSEEEDARLKAIDDLRGKDPLPGEERVPGRIGRQHAGLEIKGGLDRGGSHTPHIECVDYAFPIYPVRRVNGVRTEAEIRMQTYHDDLWKPAYSRRRSEVVNGKEIWYAAGVPLPAGVFRPAGPERDDADGCVILYDPIEHEEWDFFQVTTSHHPPVPVGGQEGTEMLEVGSLAKFDTQGMGTRVPPDGEPLGSSRATGLPYLGGLLVPEDFRDGPASVIPHALAFTFPRSRFFPFRDPTDPPDYIYPAVKSEKSHFIQNPYALAAGMRIRLKSVIRCADGRELPKDQWFAHPLPAGVGIFLTALHDYGAYLVDGAFGFGFAAEDRETAVIDPDMVPKLTGHAIEADCTPWESLLQTIDNHLSWELFPGQEQADHSYSPDLGLSLGCLKLTDGEYTFWTNFEVVAPLNVPR